MWLKLSWSILKNLLYVSVVFVAFGKLNSAFENLAFSVLLLILQSVGGARTTQLRFMIHERFGNRRNSLVMLKKMGEDTEEAEEALTEEESDYTKLNPIYYINLAGDAVLYFIILWKVFSTLLA